MEKALLVTVRSKFEKNKWRVEDLVDELEELVSTCGAEIRDHITCFYEVPSPRFFIGSGKAEEIALLCQEEGIETVIFGCDLSGTQQRNLEEVIGRKTVDRTQLILDIFARHAKSPIGKMQVELAQLRYLLPRLIGKGVILSRTGGGIGTSGPGETKLESDRRRLRKRIDKLNEDLQQFVEHRKTVRKQRKNTEIPCVSLVGYTNAGKSTLHNALTDAGQVVSNSLFTTLDSLAKNLRLPNGEHVILSDTVGFLNNLPHHLIEAFKGTLEEVVNADILIHVIDVNHPRIAEHAQAVFQVLKELGVQDKPMITALNKIDLLEDKTWLEQLKADFVNSVAISAKQNENIGALLKKIEENFSSRMVKATVQIPLTRMDLVNLFYKEGKVEEIQYLSDKIKVSFSLPKILFNKLMNSKEIEEV